MCPVRLFVSKRLLIDYGSPRGFDKEETVCYSFGQNIKATGLYPYDGTGRVRRVWRGNLLAFWLSADFPKSFGEQSQEP